MKICKVNTKLLAKYSIAADPFEDSKCKDCPYLPICEGGCPYTRINNEYFGGNKDTCHMAKNNLKELLELYYIYKLNSK